MLNQSAGWYQKKSSQFDCQHKSYTQKCFGQCKNITITILAYMRQYSRSLFEDMLMIDNGDIPKSHWKVNEPVATFVSCYFCHLYVVSPKTIHSKSEDLDPNYPAKKFELSANFSKYATKWPKNGPKWPKYDPKWPNMALEWPKMIQNGPKMTQNGPKMTPGFMHFFRKFCLLKKRYRILFCF